MHCTSCKQERNEPLTLLDRFKAWILKHLTDELADTKADSFTSGFGDGYKKGYEEAETRAKERESFHAQWENGRTDLSAVNVNLRDVLDSRGNDKIGYKLYVGGIQIPEEEASILKKEADALMRMRLWVIMQETVKQKAIEMAVLKSTTWEQCLAGKMLVHDVGLRNTMVEAILKTGKTEAPVHIP